MATENYNLPTITAEDRINGVRAINGLAEAVDSALKSVEENSGGSYVLPPASEEALGGVKIGTGISVGSDGTISVNSTWLTQQINAAVAAYMSSNYATGTTWGEIKQYGSVHTVTA